MKRVVLSAMVAIALAASCADAPEPGDLAAFCSLLEAGTGLETQPAAEDLAQLAGVAPPDVRSTIQALQDRARDFDELMAVEPPPLEALFNARFDANASRERAALDDYAEESCGIEVERPPATRWNNFVQENHGDAPWRGLVTTQFEVANDRIDTATLVFAETPEPLSLVEDVCEAVSDFLRLDGAEPGQVRVFVGAVVALEYDSPDGLCELP